MKKYIAIVVGFLALNILTIDLAIAAAPVGAAMDGSITSVTGQQALFYATAYDSDIGGTLYYQVDIDNNGTVDATTLTSANWFTQPFYYTFNTAGSYQMRIRAVDNTGLMTSWSAVHSITVGSLSGVWTAETDQLIDCYVDGYTQGTQTVGQACTNGGIMYASCAYDSSCVMGPGNCTDFTYQQDHAVIYTCTPPTYGTPSVPTLGGTTAITVGSPTSNTVVSTDPGGLTIMYDVDWDGNGTVDGTTGYFNSGTTVSIGHTYGSTGTYGVRARARNSIGNVSAWSAPYNITVSSGAPDCTNYDLCYLGISQNCVLFGSSQVPGLSCSPTDVQNYCSAAYPGCPAVTYNCEAGSLNPALSIVSNNSILGFALNNGIRWFHNAFYGACYQNTSGINYFVPTKTQAEFNSFRDHLPAGVSKANGGW